MERRLAAILAADMVGYSRLMAADEAGTIERQKIHRAALIDPKIAQYGGRIVKTTGDGMLVEFPSVVDAVQCAVEIQRAMPKRETEVPDDQRIRYRMGINLGDIVIEGDDILGDGVNVAARLESLSETEGLCISDVVYQNIQGKLGLDFEDLGEQALKNMERKVRAWNWSKTASTTAGQAKPSPGPLPLPDKPSIAVLPFTNMSDDPEQEYFADGICEDIITALSKIPKLFVVARNSTFTYKGHAVDVKQVGREQGVQYVLEGSVRRSGNRLRITAQLIDAVSGHHIWAQRYDRVLQDLFELQDEITREVTSALQVELTEGEQARLWASGTQIHEAWEIFIQVPGLIQSHRKEDIFQARRLAERALQLDENYAGAWTWLGWSHFEEVFHNWSESPDISLELAKDAAARSLSIDDSNPDTFALLTFIELSLRNYDRALEFSQRAVALGPNNSFAAGVAANVALFCNKPEDLAVLVKKAMRLCPIYPAWYAGDLAWAYLLMDRHGDAIDTAQKAVRIDPDYVYTYMVLAIALAELGREKEAREAAENIRRIEPDYTLRTFAETQPFQDVEVLDRHVDGLRKAGLPE
jgi:adenylate cyclase